jgi:hypothetical protein
MRVSLPALLCAVSHGSAVAHCIRHFPLATAFVLGSVLLAGCDSVPTESASPAAPNSNFANAPPELFNVIRFSTNDGGFFVVDEKTGLIVVEGLPTDPNTFFLCEGETNPASTLNWQTVGWLRGVIHAHLVGEDVNVHVFRLSDLDLGFPGDPFVHLWCTGTPIAAGTGRAKVLDNDSFGTGGKTNAVTFEIRGRVTDLSTGDLLRVQARGHIVQDLAGFPDVPPTVKVTKTFVRLDPIGGP